MKRVTAALPVANNTVLFSEERKIFEEAAVIYIIIYNKRAEGMKPECLPTKNPALSEAGAMTVPCGVDITTVLFARAKIRIIPEICKRFREKS